MKKRIKRAVVHPFDVEELACKILGIDYEEIDADTEIIESALCDEFDIDLEVFRDIVSRLLPLVDVGESPLTGARYRGFSDVENKMWLVKEEICESGNI